MNKFCHTVLHVMTNNPTKYEQILSYGFRGVTFTKYHGRTDRRRLLLCHSIMQRWGTKNIISILVARTHIQYIYIARKYKIYLYKFRNRKKSKPLTSFSDLFCSKGKYILFYRQWIYCVYPAMSENRKQLPNFTLKTWSNYFFQYKKICIILRLEI